MATEHVSPLNISDLSPPGGLGQADRRATRWWVLELSLGAVASAVAVATYLILSGATPIEPSPRTVALLLIGNVFVAAALVGAIAWRLYNLSRTRGTGAAGAQLHVRMVMVFAAISIVPTVMVALFSAVMLNLGIDSWFSARVKTSIDNAASLAQAYVAEQKLSMQTDVLALAADVNRQLFLAVSDPPAFREYLLRQIGGRKLSMVVIYDGSGNYIDAVRNTYMVELGNPPTIEDFKQASMGLVVNPASAGDCGPPQRHGRVGRDSHQDFVAARRVEHVGPGQRAVRVGDVGLESAVGDGRNPSGAGWQRNLPSTRECHRAGVAHVLEKTIATAPIQGEKNVESTGTGLAHRRRNSVVASGCRRADGDPVVARHDRRQQRRDRQAGRGIQRLPERL